MTLIPLSSVILTITTSYLSWLSVVDNSNLTETSTTILELFSKIMLAPLLQLLNDQSITTTRIRYSFGGNKVITVKKSASNWTFSALTLMTVQTQKILWPILSNIWQRRAGMAPASRVNLLGKLWNVWGRTFWAFFMLSLTPRMLFRSSDIVFLPMLRPLIQSTHGFGWSQIL